MGRALHVVVAAEDVGAAARDTHVAECQLQNAVGAHVGVADRVLRAAHAPDDGAWFVGGERLGDAAQLRSGHARYRFGLLGRPLLHFLADEVHAPDALANVVLVIPAVLEDVPEDAPDQRDVRAGAEAHKFRCVRGRAREARIADDEGGVVLLLGLQQVLQ